VSPDAAAFVARNPGLRAKLARAAEKLSESFPDHPLHLVLALDHESGDRDLFVEIEPRSAALSDLFQFEKQWIHDREDPQLEVNFGYFYK
jgi:hypothetical protein